MDVLVVIEDPAGYDTAIDAWRRAATVLRELPPWVALCRPRDEPPRVAGTRWYTNAVPEDVLLRLEPPARLFIAAWRDTLRAPERPGEGRSWLERGYVTPS
jgi:hypothetical protein